MHTSHASHNNVLGPTGIFCKEFAPQFEAVIVLAVDEGRPVVVDVVLKTMRA